MHEESAISLPHHIQMMLTRTIPLRLLGQPAAKDAKVVNNLLKGENNVQTL